MPPMAFQPPRGTRDFLPPAMAARRRLEDAWRRASVNAGFEEIDGPTFEHLDLYAVKSGEGIAGELFAFQRDGSDTEYALRPEFTPTLARMAAARGRSLPVPTRWFAIGPHFRAERPQRGRLREFRQWNLDVLGLPGPGADAEIIATTIAAMADLGLTPDDVVVRVSHRAVTASLLGGAGVAEADLPGAFDLLDRRGRLDEPAFAQCAATLGMDDETIRRFDDMATLTVPADGDVAGAAGAQGLAANDVAPLVDAAEALQAQSIADWCRIDLGIVRGLAYYTGLVFEVHEIAATGRAVAGGGRYDGLVSLFGGADVPACGMGMGDVVLGLVLEDRGLLDGESLLPRPDAFVITTDDEAAEAACLPTVVRLRRAGLHVRTSHRASRHLGKQLTEASKTNSRHAVILGAELVDGLALVKDLDSGEQTPVHMDDLESALGGAPP